MGCQIFMIEFLIDQFCKVNVVVQVHREACQGKFSKENKICEISVKAVVS